jgi:GTP-binding protein
MDNTERFSKAGRSLVVVNKVDRATSRLGGEVENELFDMFVALDATDEQLEYPVLFASAKQGWAVPSLDENEDRSSMKPLLDEILRYAPPPAVDFNASFSMAVTMLG